MSIDELPEILHIKHVAEYLGIWRESAGSLMKTKGFPSVKVGKRRYVYREAFKKWLMNTA